MAIQINDYPLTLAIDNREFSCRLGDWQLVIDYPLGGLLLTLQAGRQGARGIRRARVAQQNSRAKTEAELHPIREVPRWRWPE